MMNGQENVDFKKKLDEQKQGVSNQDLIEQIKKKREEQENKIKEKAKTVKFYLPLAISSIVSLIIIGSLEAFNADFRLSVLLEGNFWFKFFLFQVANITLTLSITITLIKLKKKNDKEYQTTKLQIKEHAKIDRITPFIEDEAIKEDIKRKTNAWKNKIKRKREKWRLKIDEVKAYEKVKQQEQKSKIKEIPTTNHEDDKEKLEHEAIIIEEMVEAPKVHKSQIEAFLDNNDNFIAQKKKGLKNTIRNAVVAYKAYKNTKIKKNLLKYNYMLTDEYIIENIDSLKIKYHKVSKSMLLSEVYIVDSKTSDEPVRVNRFKILSKKYASKIITTAFLTAFTGSMILEANDLSKDRIWQIAIKIFILITNAFFAVLDNDDYFQATDMYEATNTLSLLDGMKQNKIKKGEL